MLPQLSGCCEGGLFLLCCKCSHYPTQSTASLFRFSSVISSSACLWCCLELSHSAEMWNWPNSGQFMVTLRVVNSDSENWQDYGDSCRLGIWSGAAEALGRPVCLQSWEDVPESGYTWFTSGMFALQSKNLKKKIKAYCLQTFKALAWESFLLALSM